MRNFKLLIQYDGARYRGWQRLGGGADTVQGRLEAVLSRLTGEETEVVGSSRTDAGVHARGQTANFKTEKDLEPEEILRYCADYLPRDIGVTQVSAVPEQFHARYHAKGKVYLYQIWNEDWPNPFLRRYSAHVRRRLDLGRMRAAAACLVGEHDFTAFSNAKMGKKSPVRRVDAITLEEEGGLVRIRLAGGGFLHNMARKIVGTLIAAGLGELEPEAVANILSAKDRGRVPPTAEACGLTLERVVY